MKKFRYLCTVASGFVVALLCQASTTFAQSSTVTLAWDPPTLNSDGTALTDLAGYRLYIKGDTATTYGAAVKDITDKTVTKALISNLAVGKYRAVATAYDTQTPTANESVPSTELAFEVAALNVAVTGGGSVSAVDSLGSALSGIACSGAGSDCTENFAVGKKVTLKATPSSGSRFVGWSGACTGTLDCSVNVISGTNSATATFVKVWDVTVTVTGAGTVTGGSGLSTKTSQTVKVDDGTTFGLSAAADASNVFAGWSGACASAGLATTCSTKISAATAIGATFQKQATLTVNRVDTHVTVTGPGSLNCGAKCSATVNVPGTATLTATPDAGYEIVSWSIPACGTSTQCAVAFAATDGAKTVTITVAKKQFAVNVVVTGSGKVTGGTAISCPGTCTTKVDFGSAITLTATELNGQKFIQWGGDCSGTTPTCSLNNISAIKNVTAQFSSPDTTAPQAPVNLTVTIQ